MMAGRAEVGAAPSDFRNQEEAAIYARLLPIFDRHEVPEDVRFFLYSVFDEIHESNYEFPTSAETVEASYLDGDTYSDLILSHNIGHRRVRTWLSEQSAYERATPTRKGRALLRDLTAANPQWTYAEVP